MTNWYFYSICFVLTVTAVTAIIFPLWRTNRSSLLMAPLLVVLAWAGYYQWGSFTPWQQHLAQKATDERARHLLEAIKNPDELINTLRAKLDNSPASAKGWYLLGKLYANQHQQQKASEAFATAYHLDAEQEEYAVYYAHSQWMLNNQQFNAEILTIFRRLLTKNPDQSDALAMLAMHAYSTHSYKEALQYWQRLLAQVPEQSEEANALRKAIAKAQRLGGS